MSSSITPSTAFTYLTGIVVLAIGTLACGEGGSADLIQDMATDRVLDLPDSMTTPDLNLIPPNMLDLGTADGCDEDTTRPCAEGCGQERCTSGSWDGHCQSVLEACNDHDDNCNGIVDEDFVDLGLNTQCTTVLDNACETQGIWRCDSSGQVLICDAPPVVPETEVCDGSDNDCDGQTDENFANANCCTQAYQCPLGQLCEDNECIDPNAMPTDPNEANICVTDDDCSFIEACVGNVCRLACVDDVDCETGFSCDCPRGSACDLRVCQPTPDEPGCTSNADCSAGALCQNGACVSDADYCFDTAQCLNGEICDLNQNQCIENPDTNSDHCESSTDCPGGYQCDGNGTCIRLPSGGPRCVFEQDCPPGYFCDVSNRCISLYANANFCAQAITLSDTGRYQGTLRLGGQNLVVPMCGYHYIEGVLPAEVSDDVFKWTVPRTGRFIIDTADSSFDTVIARYTGCTQESVELMCNDDFEYPTSTDSKLTLMLNENEVVYLGVSGMDSFASGAYNLNYYLACVTSADCNEDSMCTDGRCVDVSTPTCVQDMECPENHQCQAGECIENMTPVDTCLDDIDCTRGDVCRDGLCRAGSSEPSTLCDEVTILPPSGTLTDTTATGAQLIEPPCAPATGNPGKDKVFAWTPNSSDNYTIRTLGNHPNPILSIFSQCDENAQLLNCNDDSGAGLNGMFTLFATEGTTYFIVVSSASDLFDGAFELSVQPVNPAPEDPECTYSNNHECGPGLVCLNGLCVHSTPTNLCGRAESLIGGSRSNGQCAYPRSIEGVLDAQIVDDCVSDGVDGRDAHWRWQPCRAGRYRITAQSNDESIDISLALYTECNGQRTYERRCEDTSINGDEVIEVDIGPNYFLSNDPYGLFQEIVISSRNANTSGSVNLVIDCIEGDCLDD